MSRNSHCLDGRLTLIADDGIFLVHPGNSVLSGNQLPVSMFMRTADSSTEATPDTDLFVTALLKTVIHRIDLLAKTGSTILAILTMCSLPGEEKPKKRSKYPKNGTKFLGNRILCHLINN